MVLHTVLNSVLTLQVVPTTNHASKIPMLDRLPMAGHEFVKGTKATRDMDESKLRASLVRRNFEAQELRTYRIEVACPHEYYRISKRV